MAVVRGVTATNMKSKRARARTHTRVVDVPATGDPANYVLRMTYVSREEIAKRYDDKEPRRTSNRSSNPSDGNVQQGKVTLTGT